jgi:hypothetical protein
MGDEASKVLSGRGGGVTDIFHPPLAMLWRLMSLSAGEKVREDR